MTTKDFSVSGQPDRGLITTEDSFLSGQVSVRQLRDGYRIGTDAVMLAASIYGGRRAVRASPDQCGPPGQ